MAHTVRVAFALILSLALLAVVLGPTTGDARASGLSAPYGFTTRDGLFVLPYYQALLGVDSITPGALVFGDELWLEIVNLEGNRTATVSVIQALSPTNWFNQTFGLAVGENVVSFTIPSSTNEVSAQLCVDGTCIAFDHQSPVTLIPSGIVTIGGIDLLAFLLTLEFAVLVIPLTVLARALTRRAIWSPGGFVPAVVAPHVVLAFAILLVYDYPFFDRVFDGLEFIFIPVVFAVVFFFWSLHLFNDATALEAFKFEPRAKHNVGLFRWRVFVGELPDGRLVLIGTGWTDWFARLLGYAPVIWDPRDSSPSNPPPAFAPVVTLKSELRGERSDRRVKAWEKRFRSKPRRESPIKQFEVIHTVNRHLAPREKDAPKYVAWVDSDKWLDADMPHLSIHRQVPAEVGPDGEIIKPARSKLSLPHYVVPQSRVSFADVHWYESVAAGLHLISAERMARRSEELRASNIALRANPYVIGDELAATQNDELFSLLDRERFAGTDAEYEEETRREAERPGPPAPPPSEDSYRRGARKPAREEGEG
jgi:hypothetical protein